MGQTTVKSAYLSGLWEGAPFFVVAAPFSALFGVVATEAGLDLAQAMGFSVIVIAGAAQFTAVQLMTEAAPVWLIIIASLAVNLRMAMYSASLQPHLGAAPFWQRGLVAYMLFDQSYVVSVARYEETPGWSVPVKMAYFAGSVTIITPTWIGFTAVGALAGQALPADWPLEFVMPLLFLSMVAPMLKTLAHLLAAITSIIVALLLVWMPSGMGLLIAAFAAMAVGAETERRMGR